jgi:hypothetical protein
MCIVKRFGERIKETKNILSKAIDVMNLDQKIELYEEFCGNTYSDSDLKDWIDNI